MSVHSSLCQKSALTQPCPLPPLVVPRWPMLPGSTGTSQGFAVAAAVLSVGGSVHTQSVLPAVYGLLYTACFTLAMRGVSSPLQLVLVFAMVGLSFALHMVFLPAGYTAQSTTHNMPSAASTQLNTHTRFLPRPIVRCLVRSGRPLLLLQSDDRKERCVDGCYRPWWREGYESSLRPGFECSTCLPGTCVPGWCFV